ncbi:hypothetical protein BC829DRAFT_449403 [Chytridium lagenaria]|nr:hypothetical protein BC829DRAFT_449403 [Chytridium lagenaria]
MAETVEPYIEAVIALHDYISAEPTCLSFRKGDLIYVHSKDDSDGWFPSNYVQATVRPQPASPVPSQETASRPASTLSDASKTKSATQKKLDELQDMLELMLTEVGKQGEDAQSATTAAPVLQVPEESGSRPASIVGYIRPRSSSISGVATAFAGGEVQSLTDQFKRVNEVQLPPFWGKKTTPQGQIYYYNTQTNQTTYSLEDVLKSEKTTRRSTLIFMDAQKAAIIAGSPLSAPLSNDDKTRKRRSSGWKLGPSLIASTQKITWEMLINNVLRGISDLNRAADEDKRSLFLEQTNIMLRAIRDMMIASGTITNTSPALANSATLRAHHHSIMLSLSKLVIAAKIASGLWPPPDSVASMKYEASQVLLGVRHFVSTGQELNLELREPTADASFEFEILGSDLSSGEFVSRLDDGADKIIKSVARLVAVITMERRASGVLVEHARVTVTVVGQLMSLAKESAYDVVNDLITFTRTSMDSFAPPKALSKLLDSTSGVLKATDDLVISTKLLIDSHDFMEQQSLITEAEMLQNSGSKRESDLHQLGLDRRPSISSVADSAGTDGANTLVGADTYDSAYHPNEAEDSYLKSPATTPNLSHLRIPGTRSSFGVEQKRQSESLGRSGETMLSPWYDDFGSPSFFGERPKEDSFKSDRRLWFLDTDYTPDSISFNKEGAVNGGTFQALVERLTLHDQPAAEFVDRMIARYLIVPPPNINSDDLKIWQEKKQTPIRLRVYNTWKLWLESYWIEEEDGLMLETLSGRLLQILQGKYSTMQTGARGSTSSRPPRKINNDDPPAPIVPRVSYKKLTLIDIDPLEVARQITLIQSRMFNSIQPSELINLEWSRKGGRAVNVRAMTDMSNKITGWVVDCILSEVGSQKRAALLKQFIKIGDRAVILKNFDLAMAVVSALNSSAVSRLNKTWALLSNKTSETLHNLQHITDNSRNYANYRSELRTAHQTFDKFVKAHKIITDLQRFQLPYALTEVVDLSDWIYLAIKASSQKDAHNLYDLSLVLEPRGTKEPDEAQALKELEVKLRLLENAGLLKTAPHSALPLFYLFGFCPTVVHSCKPEQSSVMDDAVKKAIAGHSHIKISGCGKQEMLDDGLSMRITQFLTCLANLSLHASSDASTFHHLADIDGIPRGKLISSKKFEKSVTVDLASAVSSLAGTVMTSSTARNMSVLPMRKPGGYKDINAQIDLSTLRSSLGKTESLIFSSTFTIHYAADLSVVANVGIEFEFFNFSVKVADQAHLFKMITKSVGIKHGITPSFLAKPHNDLPGCSGHIHVSLSSFLQKKNVFAPFTDDFLFFGDGAKTGQMVPGLTKLGESFLAGILEGLPSAMACYAPNINRFASQEQTSTLHCYCRILASGLEGVRSKMPLTLKPLENQVAGVDPKPAKDSFARKVLGDEFVEHYAGTRKHEWKVWETAVTNWELKRYLEVA